MARIVGWAIAVVFVLAALGMGIEGHVGPGFVALLVAALAFPPLWEWEPLGNVPLAGRITGGVVAVLLIPVLSPSAPSSGPTAATSAPAAQQPSSASTTPLPVSDAAPAAKPSNWNESQELDPMRNKSTYYDCIISDNALQFSFPYGGGSSGHLCFRNSPRFGTDVYLRMDKGQSTCSFEGCTLHMKFDDGPILAFGATEASGGNTDTVFIHGYARLKQLMRKSKHMILEAEFFQEGVQQLDFTVSGFDWKH